MNDYTGRASTSPTSFFTICLGVAIFFCVRSWKDGYWGKEGEEIKYRMFDEEHSSKERAARSSRCHRRLTCKPNPS